MSLPKIRCRSRRCDDFRRSIDLGRSKALPELLETLRVHSDEIEYALLWVRKRKEHAEFPKRLHDSPLRPVCVLKLVQDDDGVHRRNELPYALTSMKDVTDIRCIQVEADAPFLPREPGGSASSAALCAALSASVDYHGSDGHNRCVASNPMWLGP